MKNRKNIESMGATCSCLDSPAATKTRKKSKRGVDDNSTSSASSRHKNSPYHKQPQQAKQGALAKKTIGVSQQAKNGMKGNDSPSTATNPLSIGGVTTLSRGSVSSPPPNPRRRTTQTFDAVPDGEGEVGVGLQFTVNDNLDVCSQTSKDDLQHEDSANTNGSVHAHDAHHHSMTSMKAPPSLNTTLGPAELASAAA